MAKFPLRTIGLARSLVVDVGILASWFLSLGLVLAHEHGLGTRALNLSWTIAGPSQATEQWFGIYYQGQKIGFAHTAVSPDEQEGIPGFSINDHGRLRFGLLGIPQVLEVRTKAFVGPDWRLRNLLAAVEAGSYSLRLVGKRQGEVFLLTLSSRTPQDARGSTSSITQKLQDPSGAIWISGLSSWAAFHKLKAGQRGRLQVVNPLAIKSEYASFHVKRNEVVDGQEALVIETDYRGLTATTWITPQGVVLKETSPMGWSLVQEPMEQALAIERKGAILPDLLSTSAVAVDRPIDNPARLKSLTLLIEGIEESAFGVDRRPWQEVLKPKALEAYGQRPPSGPWCIVRLKNPTILTAEGSPSQPRPPHAMSSLFVQSDDPMLAQQARDIVGQISKAWPQAVALHHWVYDTLEKRLTIGLPSAKDVLLSKAGDCHEHTVLFTALARSLGIPTRMVAGLVYYQDRFYYHAWPEVWSANLSSTNMQVGRWIPMDPTIGQVIADPTHIGLIEAEGEDLVALARFVGQIRLRVLEATEEDKGP